MEISIKDDDQNIFFTTGLVGSILVFGSTGRGFESLARLFLIPQCISEMTDFNIYIYTRPKLSDTYLFPQFIFYVNYVHRWNVRL